MRCRCILLPLVPVDDVLPRRLRQLFGRASQPTGLFAGAEPQVLAERFRAQCAEHGPWEIAAAIGAPPNCNDLRFIAYLLAHAVGPGDALDLCVERGVGGLEEWLDLHPNERITR